MIWGLKVVRIPCNSIFLVISIKIYLLISVMLHILRSPYWNKIKEGGKLLQIFQYDDKQ